MNFSTTFQKLLKGFAKVAIFLVAVVLAAALLSGYGRSAFDVKQYHGKRFETVAKYDDCEIIVDIETGVEYFRKDTGYADAICVLLDSYGNPILFPGFDAREDALPGQKIG